MTDLWHFFSSDLVLSAIGDLLIADGLDESTQRVLRRLSTNIRDYLWQPGYGAGLPGYVGKNLDVPSLTALIQSQMYLEASVSQNPPPQIVLQQIVNGISVQIAYTNVETGQSTLLSFTVTP
jgi:hypothetical protein